MREYTNTQKGKQTDLREGADLKEEKKPESSWSLWPLIPLWGELKGERWATDCWAGLLQHFTTPFAERELGGCSEALSQPHKEKGKVKEDYKKEGLFKGRGGVSGKAFCVWHSGQRQAGFIQWEALSKPPSPSCLSEEGPPFYSLMAISVRSIRSDANQLEHEDPIQI